MLTSPAEQPLGTAPALLSVRAHRSVHVRLSSSQITMTSLPTRVERRSAPETRLPGKTNHTGADGVDGADGVSEILRLSPSSFPGVLPVLWQIPTCNALLIIGAQDTA